MSGESSELDVFSSTEDIELKEFSRSCDGFSGSRSSEVFTASDRRSIKESETEEDEVNDVVTTSLHTSEKDHHQSDIERTSLSSLECISPKDLNMTIKSSADRQASALTGKTSSPKEPLIRSRSIPDCSKRPSARMTSSLDPLNESASTLYSLERPSSRMVSSLDPLNGPSTRSISSVDPMERPSSRKVSSLDPLSKPSTRRVLSVDPMERPSSRKVSSLDPLSKPSTRRVLSVNPMERPSSRIVSSLDTLNGPSTRSFSSVDPLEGPSAKRASSLDPAGGSSCRSISSANPLEGTSTQTVWFSDSTEDSSASVCNSHHSEIETNEPSDSEPTTEPNGSCFRTLAFFFMRSSRLIRSSKCYLLFNVALLALSFSAGYMGSRYDELCDFCRGLPRMVYGLGSFGVALTTFRIANILEKHHFIPPVPGRCFNTLMMFVFLPFFMYLIDVSNVIYSCDPDFTPSKANKKFCIKVFYNYAYYLNEIVPLVIVVLILIHAPGWFDPAEDE